jgi:hypothetical protein
MEKSDVAKKASRSTQPKVNACRTTTNTSYATESNPIVIHRDGRARLDNGEKFFVMEEKRKFLSGRFSALRDEKFFTFSTLTQVFLLSGSSERERREPEKVKIDGKI